MAIVEMLIEMFKAGDHDVFEHYDEAIEWDTTRGVEHVRRDNGRLPWT